MKICKSGMMFSLMSVMVFAVACTSYEIDKANQLVDSSNSFITAANASDEQAGKLWADVTAKLTTLEEDEGEALEAIRTQAKEVIATSEKSRDGFRAASAKFEEASKLNLPEKYKEYLGVRAQELKKHADAQDLAIGQPKALLETESAEEYTKKINDIAEKVKAAQKEADDLKQKADKIYQENKALFKN